MKNNAIGVFDSGLGGLSVLKELNKEVNDESYIYFADSYNAPYGKKTVDELNRFSYNIVNFFLEKNVKLIFIACHTVSTVCIDFLKASFDTPIIGIADIAVNEASKRAKKNLGIIATELTIKSEVHENKVKKKNKNINVFTKATPLFVPMIEEGFLKGDIAYQVVKEYLSDFISDNDLDTLLLACTHYPLLMETFEYLFDEKTEILDPSKAGAKFLKKFLIENNLKNSKKDKDLFFTSASTDLFDDFAGKILKTKIKSELIKLE